MTTKGLIYLYKTQISISENRNINKDIIEYILNNNNLDHVIINLNIIIKQYHQRRYLKIGGIIIGLISISTIIIIIFLKKNKKKKLLKKM